MDETTAGLERDWILKNGAHHTEQKRWASASPAGLTRAANQIHLSITTQNAPTKNLCSKCSFDLKFNLAKLCNAKVLFMLRVYVFFKYCFYLKTTLRYDSLIWNAIYSTGHPKLGTLYSFAFKRLIFHAKFSLGKFPSPLCRNSVRATASRGAASLPRAQCARPRERWEKP